MLTAFLAATGPALPSSCRNKEASAQHITSRSPSDQLRKIGNSSSGSWRTRADLAVCPTLNRFAVGIQEFQLAQIQLPHAGLDLSAVSDHHPHQVIRPHHALCPGLHYRK